MKKFVSIIAAAAIAASMTAAGAMSSFAEAETTVPAEQTLPVSESADTAYSISKEDAEAKALADAAKRGLDAIVRSSEYDAENNCWNISLQRNGGTKIVFYSVGETTLTFNDPEAKEEAESRALADAAKRGLDAIVRSSEYDAENNCWNISLQRNGGTKIVFYHVGEDTLTFIDHEAEEAVGTSAVSSAATSQATSSAATTTTAAASTTQKASAAKSTSPKTGVAFPAVSAAVLVLSAASVAFTLKKKED